MTHEKRPLFGLVGQNIEYSFSRNYFTEKFRQENIAAEYRNFDISDIAHLPQIIGLEQNLAGFNVTIPYKESIIPFLDKLSETAAKIGAVNTVKITADGQLIGHNTDWSGFLKSLQPLLLPHHKRALILGTGGSSKAVAFALSQLHIDFDFVSRTPSAQHLSYNELTVEVMAGHQILVNCTPVGTFPDVDAAPPIPFEYINAEYLVIDLIYNPAETTFLRKASASGAIIKNGYEMLVFQAEQAWEIWQMQI
ncbi:MAG TPA: shikimate dehydrogenase [Flavobacterium sp.]|nr:shikimate dehydrogenase [Flavobacterium sp.]